MAQKREITCEEVVTVKVEMKEARDASVVIRPCACVR